MAQRVRKTHKGTARRFRVTGKKKVKRGSAGMSHLMSTKSGKRRRRLRKGVVVPNTGAARKIRRMLAID